MPVFAIPGGMGLNGAMLVPETELAFYGTGVVGDLLKEYEISGGGL